MTGLASCASIPPTRNLSFGLPFGQAPRCSISAAARHRLHYRGLLLRLRLPDRRSGWGLTSCSARHTGRTAGCQTPAGGLSRPAHSGILGGEGSGGGRGARPEGAVSLPLYRMHINFQRTKSGERAHRTRHEALRTTQTTARRLPRRCRLANLSETVVSVFSYVSNQDANGQPSSLRRVVSGKASSR